MNLRQDIVDLLNQGHSNIAITRQLRCDHRTVAAHRTTLGLPPAHRGRRSATTITDAFTARTQPLDGGHLRWTGYRDSQGIAVLSYLGHNYTARRIAFRIRTGRDPVGAVKAGCSVDGCVAPQCMDDRQLRARHRETYAAVFGAVA